MMIQTIRAVCFDLDDTLYPQTSWLAGAWDAVATTAARSGVDETGLREALDACAAHGSDGGRIIDRALARVGAHRVEVEPLVETFRSHAPEHLDLYEGAGEALTRIAACVPLGLISDGDPQIQRTKMSALGVPAANVVYVGDRPAKDVAGAIAAGLAAIRVRTGEWAASDDDPRAEQSCADVVEAIDALLTRLDPH
jgi:putative hydrolase of the HAD superfamily